MSGGLKQQARVIEAAGQAVRDAAWNRQLADLQTALDAWNAAERELSEALQEQSRELGAMLSDMKP